MSFHSGEFAWNNVDVRGDDGLLHSGRVVDVPLAGTARLLAYVMAEQGLPAVERVLVARNWHLHDYTSNPIKTLYDALMSLAAVCQWVSLKNARINVELVPPPPHYPDDESDENQFIIVRFSNQRITRQLTVEDFWTLLNNRVGKLSTEDVNHLTEWITRRSSRESIARILNMTQAMDPRDGVRDRGICFSGEDNGGLDGVDVRHLTKLSVHALYQLLKPDDPWDFAPRSLTILEVD